MKQYADSQGGRPWSLAARRYVDRFIAVSAESAYAGREYFMTLRAPLLAQKRRAMAAAGMAGSYCLAIHCWAIFVKAFDAISTASTMRTWVRAARPAILAFGMPWRRHAVVHYFVMAGIK